MDQIKVSARLPNVRTESGSDRVDTDLNVRFIMKARMVVTGVAESRNDPVATAPGSDFE